MINSNIWLQPGILMVYGSALDTAMHKHHVIQIIWPTGNARCQLENEKITGAAIINSQVTHQLHMDAGWVILVEPQSDFGQQLTERLEDNILEKALDFLSLAELSLKPATAVNYKTKEPDYPAKFIASLKPLLTALDLDIDLAISRPSVSLTDQRIQSLLNDLDNCLTSEYLTSEYLTSECLKPSHWSAAEVASQLALSQGRFLHLFREQMGIAWRPYLLWRRMICAIAAMMKGSKATDAAYIAGFSDSSHLSRTFRAHFGMSIRDAQALIKDS